MNGVKRVPVAKYVLGLDGAQLIPVEMGGKLAPPIATITELGKQLLNASAEGNAKEIQELLNKGAPFTADWLGTSPLHFAAQNNHLDICKILLKAGISRDARTKVDRTPLHLAAYEGHLEIAEILLKHGAYCDARDLLAMTPLHWAVQNNHCKVAELLLRYGAQADVVNKFELTPADIAVQNNRQDVLEIITLTRRDPSLASLEVVLSEMDALNDQVIEETISIESSSIPLETVLLEDSDNEMTMEKLDDKSEPPTEEKRPTDEETPINAIEDRFSDSFKLLQQHGITMLPTDDSNILNSILETGHSVVLTEAGKQILNSTKPEVKVQEPIRVAAPIKPKKIITVTPQEFLAMTSNLSRGNNAIVKQINGRIVNTIKSPTLKRIIMKKNKIVPIVQQQSNSSRLSNIEGMSDVEILMKQLIEARKMVEEYKQKFLKKEAEAEKYKQQLKLLMQAK